MVRKTLHKSYRRSLSADSNTSKKNQFIKSKYGLITTKFVNSFFDKKLSPNLKNQFMKSKNGSIAAKVVNSFFDKKN